MSKRSPTVTAFGLVSALLLFACGDSTDVSATTGTGGNGGESSSSASTTGSATSTTGQGGSGGEGGEGGQGPVLPSWKIDLLDWAATTIQAIPDKDTEGFVIPDEPSRETFRLASEALRNHQLGEAVLRAQEVEYQVVEIIDTGDGDAPIYALLPASWTPTDATGGHGRGMFFLRDDKDVNKYLAMSSPHPRFDSYSGLVATNAFRQTRARSLAVAGTHRCANKQQSECSGTTSVCGYSTYRESDMAHMDRGFFQVFHEVMDADDNATIQHIQVHGFASANDDPEFTLSAGTSKNVDDPNFTPNLLATAFSAIIAKAGSSKPGNSCNQTGHINRLCASTNTQGRYTNGVDAGQVCTVSSGGVASGRFVHAELSKAIRDAKKGSLGPQVFIDALLEVF